MARSVTIKGMTFKKSSFSDDDEWCVGVNCDGIKIHVVNTKDKSETICTFSYPEWEAFIKGVKNNEFDF